MNFKHISIRCFYFLSQDQYIWQLYVSITNMVNLLINIVVATTVCAWTNKAYQS